jgi:hypothetical protein
LQRAQLVIYCKNGRPSAPDRGIDGRYGLERMREPYIKHLEGSVWECALNVAHEA